LLLRENDGWNTIVPIEGSTEIGKWRPTAPMFEVAVLPQWGEMATFSQVDAESYAGIAPPALDSVEYANAYNEVKSLGQSAGSTRTANQTQIARFWADGAGTYTPPGHWNQIATEAAQSRNVSLTESARLFAQLNGAIAAGQQLTGVADGTGSAIAALSYQWDGGAAATLAVDTSTGAFQTPLNPWGTTAGIISCRAGQNARGGGQAIVRLHPSSTGDS
jgi:hypothetical protein